MLCMLYEQVCQCCYRICIHHDANKVISAIRRHDSYMAQICTHDTSEICLSKRLLY